MSTKIKILNPEQLLEKHKDYLEFKADYYSSMGLEYDDVYNQGYCLLLEAYEEKSLNYLFPVDSEKLIVRVDNELRNYYNRETKEKYNKYGLDPQDYSENQNI